MKPILFTSVLLASLFAIPAQAGEIFSDSSVNSALAGASKQSVRTLDTCLTADVEIASSRAIRACTKAYKASVPNYELRSQILTRRGLLYLSSGDYSKASRDFGSAGRLSDDNNVANLGKGYAALMKQDYDTAMSHFEDCGTDADTAPLATYGLAVTQEMAGDSKSARETYKAAADLRPNWDAPRKGLQRVQVKG